MRPNDPQQPDVEIGDDDGALDWSNPILDQPPPRFVSPAPALPANPWATLDRRYVDNERIVAGLSDEQVATLVAEVTKGKPALAAFVAKRNVRKCPSCRRLIADRLAERNGKGA